MMLRRRLFLSFIAIISLYTTSPIYSDTHNDVASSFKAPNAKNLPEEVEKWKLADEALWEYVNTHVPAVLEHTGAAAFDLHLKGVQAVLRYWKAPVHLTNAGLFHSIYGTEGFQGFSLSLQERGNIQSMIGEKAERLCWIFCMVDRYIVDQTVFAWNAAEDGNTSKDTDTDAVYATFRARPELGRFEIQLSKQEWLDFLELSLADWLEQVEGAALTESEIFHWDKPGEAYAYRRLAYAKMSEILSKERADRLGEVVPSMLKAVMATENDSTKQLHQERTPNMSQAAKDAWNALRSAGEEVPLDFAPRPMSDQECKNV